MKVTVYTCNIGNYDILADPVSVEKDIEYICVSDTPVDSKVWKWKKVANTGNYLHDSKYYKLHPWKVCNTKISIYIDANIKIRGSIMEFVKVHLRNNRAVFFDHNNTVKDDRNCLYDEIRACIDKGKGSKKHLEKLMSYIHSKGYAANNGLICGGVIMRQNCPSTRKTMRDWWQMCLEYTMRDQCSFNFVAWRNNYKFKMLKKNIRDNSTFYIVNPHKSKL